MRQILKIAWRSIWRSRRRTLINMSAVAFGLAFLLLGAGIMESFVGQAQNDLGNTGMGHIEIFARDYRVKKDVRELIDNPFEIAKKLQSRVPAGSRVGWRVVVRGLASSAHGSRGVRIHGVDPAAEARLSRFYGDIRQGEPLAPTDARGILVGQELARRLKLKVASKVRVMAQRADGEVGAELFRVRGIFHAVSPSTSSSQAFVTVSAAQRLLGIDNAAHQVLAQLPVAARAGPLADELQAELGGDFEVLSFADLFPTLELLQKYMDRILFISVFGIYLLVGLGVLNTMLMGVMERTREFGIMMAVGTRQGRLVAVILGESFWIASIAVAAGLICGAGICWLVAEYSLLDWSDSIGEGMDFAGSTVSAVVRPELKLHTAIAASAIVWTLTLAVGFYPAWRVSRLAPADALRAV